MALPKDLENIDFANVTILGKIVGSFVRHTLVKKKILAIINSVHSCELIVNLIYFTTLYSVFVISHKGVFAF